MLIWRFRSGPAVRVQGRVLGNECVQERGLSFQKAPGATVTSLLPSSKQRTGQITRLMSYPNITKAQYSSEKQEVFVET